MSYTCVKEASHLLLYIVYYAKESFIEHLNSYLEEFRGDSSEPVTGNSATLFSYTKCIAISF